MLSVRNRFSGVLSAAVIATAVLPLFSDTQARADVMTTLVGGPVASGNSYLWTYDVELGFDAEAKSGVTSGTLFDVGTSLPTVQSINGLLGSSFTFSYAKVTTPPAGVSPTDSSNLYNIQYTYNGSSILMGSAYTITIGSTPVQVGTNVMDLGQFTILSPTNVEVSANYDGQSMGSFGSALNLPQADIGSTFVPSAAAVPEPVSLGLLSAGAMCLLGRRQRRI